MKRVLLLGAALAAVSLVVGCANQQTASNAGANRHGLVDTGSVAPVSGGPGRPGRTPQRYQP